MESTWENRISVASQKYKARDFLWKQIGRASYYYAIAALSASCTILEGLDEVSTQGDASLPK